MKLATLGILFIGTAAFAQVPPEIAKQLVNIGRGVCVPETAEVYRPLHPNPPYSGVLIERNISFGPNAQDVADVFSAEKGGGNRAACRTNWDDRVRTMPVFGHPSILVEGLLKAHRLRAVGLNLEMDSKSGLKLKPVGPPADPNASISMETEGGSGRRRFAFRGASAASVFSAIRAAAPNGGTCPQRFRCQRRGFRIAQVVDETGLTGYYDGDLQFTLPFPSTFDRFPPPESLEEALTRQLGLTLELRRSPGKVLVLRSSDRMPTEN